MKYELGTNILDAVKAEFCSALSFIAETTVYVTLQQPSLIKAIAGVNHYEVKGEYSVGEASGDIKFMYIETPTEISINRILVSMGGSGMSDCPFETPEAFYNALLNKHKAFVSFSRTTPIRMQRISTLCDDLENLECAQHTHNEIVKIVSNIRVQLG